ncbi:glutamate carboxypeptidase [Catenulispora sp. MAP5-51]|uniref:M20 family metallopeptidase n=1 Tax=Catenulispora sp. MAP5-51 TaxID=3156298 RepID=UPI0035179C7A
MTAMDLPSMLADLETLVCCESPTADRAATSRCADLFADMGSRLLGMPAERLDHGGAAQLRWRFGAGDRVLLLGHLDTVWPHGTLERLPFAVTDGKVTGPGCFDMKAGLVQMLHALAALRQNGRNGQNGPDALDGVSILVTTDEEVGSPAARTLIQDEARRNRAVLVLEASAGTDGALKTARKGAGCHRLHVQGRAAHAGLEPERGANAAVELAHQILEIVKLADPEAGTTVTPSLTAAGDSANTVPATAQVAVDVRAFSVEEQARVGAGLEALRPRLDGTSLRIERGPESPPLPPESSSELFARAERAAARLGMPPLRGIAVGGGSDGNWTAAVGTPTLDGLGAVGGGAHAEDEHVLAEAMPERAALLAELVADLLGARP